MGAIFGQRKTRRRRGRPYTRAMGLGFGAAALGTGLVLWLVWRQLRQRAEPEGEAVEAEAVEAGRVERLKSAARRLISRERQRANEAEQQVSELQDELEEERKPWWQRIFDKVKEIRS